MIKKEFYKTRNDGVNLFRTYSTDGLKIQKVGTGETYDEAVKTLFDRYGVEYGE